MAIRDKLRASAASQLDEGEQIQSVFSAQSASPWLAIISFWIIVLKSAYRVVVVTDRRIMVFQAGKLQVTKIKGLLRELPRATAIGPADGLWYQTDALGEHLWIHKRWAKDIADADATAPAAA